MTKVIQNIGVNSIQKPVRHNFTCNVTIPGFYNVVVEYKETVMSHLEKKMQLFELQGPLHFMSLMKKEFKQSDLQELQFNLSKSSPIMLKIFCEV